MSPDLVGPNVLSAGASFVDPEKLGMAIGSGSSQGITPTLDEETGIEVEISLKNLIDLINEIQSQNWHVRLSETIENISENISNEILESFNAIAEEEGVFFDILGIYNGKTLETIGPAIIGDPPEDTGTGGEGEEEEPVEIDEEKKFKTSLQMLSFWMAESVVGVADVDENNQIISIMGDVERFSPAISLCEAYIQQNNQFIDSVSSLKDSELTVTDNTEWMTSGVSGVTLATREFGEDLANTGRLLDFSEIQNLGNPGSFLKRLSQTGALIVILEALQETDINIQQITENGAGSPPAELKKLYTELDTITGDELEQLKSVLRLTTDNIESAADLLDPKKIFPNSYFTLKSPVFGSEVESKPIYSGRSGAISQDFNQLGGSLRSILPPDIAAANSALARSLGQITNISSVQVEEFASELQELETLKDIDTIETKDTLVDQDVEDVWLDNDLPIPLGSGPDGSLLLADMIGIVSGYNIAAPLTQNSELFSELETSGAFDVFTNTGSSSDPSIGFFQVIEYLLNGNYTNQAGDGGALTTVIPAGVKGEGNYSGSTQEEQISNAWFEGVLPELVAATKQVVTDNPETAEIIIRNSNRWQHQLARETINRGRLLEPDFYELPHSRQDALQFAQQLPRWGNQTTIGGAGQILEGIADRSNRGGQAMIAAMREGRNVQRLESVGVSTRSSRPRPEGEKIDLSGSQISAADAESRL